MTDLLLNDYIRVKLIFNILIMLFWENVNEEWLIRAWEIETGIPAVLAFDFNHEGWIF